MEYAPCTLGRVFVVRFEDGDDLVVSLKELARKETVKAATVQLLGGMQCGSMVCGPKEPVLPPEPMWESFSDGREVVGFGTIFPGEDGEPALHLHGAVGKGKQTLTGCIRKDTRVFIVVEAVVTELTGIDAVKAPDPKTGISMLSFG